MCAALCCALSTDGASVKDTNESNETEGKTAPEIYTTVKHLREGAEGGREGLQKVEERERKRREKTRELTVLMVVVVGGGLPGP